MTSAFGIEHEISKYSRAYGTARKVPDHTTRMKLKKLPDTDKIIMRRKKLSKSFSDNAVRLAEAARKGHPYAQARLAAGQAGKSVNFHQKAAQEAGAATKGIKRLNPKVRGVREAGKTSAIVADNMKNFGRGSKLGAQKIVNDASAASRVKTPAVAAAAPAKQGWSTGNKLMAASVGAGAAGGAGGALYANRKRSA